MAGSMRHSDRAGRDGPPQRILGDVTLGVLFPKTGELPKLLGPKEPEDQYWIDISYPIETRRESDGDI